jgi:CcmD family protein
MEARNFTFMFYGFTAAWVIVLVYVISLARRGARLKKELEQVKQLFNATPETRGERIEERVR